MTNAIRTVLQHRCRVRRGAGEVLEGVPQTSWTTVAENVPCLLDAGERQIEPTWTQEQQRTADRTGHLFAHSDSGIQPGDRLIMTRGPSGTFLVKPDPAHFHFLNSPAHAEFRVEEVPGQ